jgi:ribonuclease G
MSEEVLINATASETRVAMVEKGVLQEIIIERSNRQSLVGNIYKGKVCRVLPGMQAAFIDIGLERNAFLHFSNLVDIHQTDKKNSIDKLLREGQTLLVQVIKEPLGTKGARLTALIAIPSRYMIFLPGSSNMIGISHRIESIQERQRLKDIVLQYTGITDHGLTETPSASKTRLLTYCDNYAFIVRTATEGVEENLLCADIDFLCQLWKDIIEQEITAKPGSLIYTDLSLVLRTARDLIGTKIDRVRIDSPDIYREAFDFAKKFVPELVPLMELYSGEQPIFDLYSVNEEITKALERKVSLKSGGNLVIDQTEAMTIIDVNTGGYVGERNLEETIFHTNLEAAQAIARQLRLRNLGGIIILDFIDMQEPEHKRQVLQTLTKCLKHDHAKTKISKFSSLGLVQMTRQRTRDSLEQVLCKTCPTCHGQGLIKTI